jgi:hypothetical protein
MRTDRAAGARDWPASPARVRNQAESDLILGGGVTGRRRTDSASFTTGTSASATGSSPARQTVGGTIRGCATSENEPPERSPQGQADHSGTEGLAGFRATLRSRVGLFGLVAPGRQQLAIRVSGSVAQQPLDFAIAVFTSGFEQQQTPAAFRQAGQRQMSPGRWVQLLTVVLPQVNVRPGVGTATSVGTQTNAISQRPKRSRIDLGEWLAQIRMVSEIVSTATEFNVARRDGLTQVGGSALWWVRTDDWNSNGIECPVR